MVEETPSGTTGNGKPYPFPSRKDIHGSRIPKSQGVAAESAHSQAQDAASAASKGQSLRDSIQASRQGALHRQHSQPGQGAETGTTPTQWGFPSKEAQVPTSGAQTPRTSSHAASFEATQPSPQAPAETPSISGAKRPVPNTPQVPRSRTNTGQTRAAVPVTGSVAVAKGRQRKRRRAIKTTLILLLVLALLGAAVWFAVRSLSGDGSQAESDDYPGPGHGEVVVTVDPGDHGSDIGQTLYDAGVVKSPEAFIRAFDNNSAAASIRPGNYTLKYEMSGAGALAAMLDETNRSDNTITVTAGQTVAQVKERLVLVAGFTEEEVDAAFSNSEAIGLPAVANGNPEGWPAPGSYEISTTGTPEAVIAQMIAATVETLTTLGVPEDQWMEVLTKASILEREAGNHIDLPKVARVIENRLEMTDAETVGLLQMDSTALYGVGKSGGIPTPDDLKDDNPYNTYIHKGLPPGPIASPSVEAIEATLNPAEGSWLYFVTVNLDTGETLFADTLAEQEANQELLTQWCEANGGCS